MTLNALIVARKEILDHSRDTRSVTSTVLQALMGPALVLLVSFSPAARSASSHAALISMLSVFALCATFTGGMNVAMDSMAGERERRSLVPLLLNPVLSRDIVLGKWIAVSLFAVGVLAINIAGAVLVLEGRASGSLTAQTPALSTWVLFGLVPLALLGAALELLIAARCRTAKEAQTLLMAVILAPMLVGMFMAFYPRLSGGWWFVVPIIGQQALIGKALLGQPVSPWYGIVVAGVTFAAAVPFLVNAARVLESDSILVG